MQTLFILSIVTGLLFLLIFILAAANEWRKVAFTAVIIAAICAFTALFAFLNLPRGVFGAAAPPHLRMGFFMMAISPLFPHTVPVKTIQNKKARFDYEITETVEAGLILTGQEAKACRDGHVDMNGSYVSFASGKPMIKNLKIMKYKFASGLDGYEPGHDRVLLLNKKEIEKLSGSTNEKGISIVPLELRAGRYIKLLIGLGRGRKSIDKRRVIKERDVQKRLKQGKEI